MPQQAAPAALGERLGLPRLLPARDHLEPPAPSRQPPQDPPPRAQPDMSMTREACDLVGSVRHESDGIVDAKAGARPQAAAAGSASEVVVHVRGEEVNAVINKVDTCRRASASAGPRARASHP